jgi:tetratricopeptide (TPR) repeat protein
MINIFFSLATTSQDDRILFNKLLKSLRVLRRQGLIHVLHDSLISPGDNKDDFINAFLGKAHIIVLLMSPDFFDSDQCVQVEMPYALERQQARVAHVIPVLLRPTEWEGFQLERSSLLPSNGQAVTIWKNLDTALLEVTRGIRQVVKEITHQLTSALTPVKPLPFPLCTLPYRQHPFFTDRDDILTELYDTFTSSKSVQVRTQVLSGPRGVGKTFIALEYARRHRHEYDAILWLNATTPELLSADIITLAAQLGIPEQNGGDKQQRFAAVWHWLQDHERWFVVLDNLEDFTLISQLIPLKGSGHVLLITHTQVSGVFDSLILVPQMTVEDGALLLLRRATIIPEKGSRISASETAFAQASAIAQEVECYPLSLDQAGVYIKETHLSPALYLKRYHQQKWRSRYLHWQGWFAKERSVPDTTTLALTFKKIAQIDPNAWQLLCFFAFLYPDALPDEAIMQGASSLIGPLHTIVADPLFFDNALATLQRFALVHLSADSTILNMPVIIQFVIRKDLTKKQRNQLANQAVRLINSIFPDEILFETWETCERYLPQAQHCSTLIHDFHLTLKEGGLLLERLGFYYYQRGCYSEANTYLTQALHLQEKHQDEDPSGIAQTLNSLGLLSQRLARYQDAKVLHQRALALREQVPDHPQTAESLHNLAVLYEHDGQYQQAGQLYLHALSLDERVAGVDHPDTLKTLNNLALMYYLQGDYSKAETAYQRVLTIYERSLSPDHPDLTYILNGMGTLAEKRGDDQMAAELYQRALTIREQALGKEHSETAHNINKYARINELQGNYQQAEALYRQALASGEKMLGSEHPDIALFLNNLALLAYKQGQYTQAEPLYQRALGIYELTPGTERAAFAQVLNNLGRLYHKTKNMERAEALLRQALAIREQLLGMTHPDTAQSLSNLADLLTDQHRYEEAHPLYKQALAILLDTFGPAHPDVTHIRESLKRNEEGQPPTEPSQNDH